MTCKISFIKSIRETLKHHMASVFGTCLIFFIQLIIFFLNVQNYTSDYDSNIANRSYIREQIADMTAPSFIYVVPIVLVAILLAFDFFRYLHSKKQVDFYESLPVHRKQWFLLRTCSAFLTFIIPYLVCTVLEMVLLSVFGFRNPTFFTNLLWNFVCMVLIFLITWLTFALAMIMTGHSVIALFGFGVFSAYAPLLLRYLYPTYASEYFDTYVTDMTRLQHLTYISPIGLVYKLINTNSEDWSAADHIKEFVIIFVMILAVGVLAYLLFRKRPSEAAGRAMAFEKWNPVIRIMLVIPITLYIGLYLSIVTSAASKVWMIFGFVIGTILVHGIIESIFQFDIRGLWSKKKQMICCFIACVGFAFVFWVDLFHYDEYLPDLDELEAISIDTNRYYGDIEDDGISGEYLDDALLLAQNLVEQDLDISHESEWISFEYRLKNGVVKKRQYYIDYESNQELFDKIYATKEYKDDICPLYTYDWDKIINAEWGDAVTQTSLYMSDAEMEHLFETYLAEYTPLIYSQVRNEAPVGYIILNYNDNTSDYDSFSCDVYPEFTQTISLLEEIMQSHTNTKDYGSLSESVIDKYPVQSLEIYHEDGSILISETDKINAIKDELILTDNFYKMNTNVISDQYYDGGLHLVTKNGVSYVSIVLPKDVAYILLADYN